MNCLKRTKQIILKNRGTVLSFHVFPSHHRIGIETLFLPITKTMGLKIFADEDECRRSLERQIKAAILSAAPPLVSKKVFRTGSNTEMEIAGYLFSKFFNLYSYITRIAKPLGMNTFRMEKDTRFCKMESRLEQIGCDTDLHNENVMLYRNAFVKVDFGDASTWH